MITVLNYIRLMRFCHLRLSIISLAAGFFFLCATHVQAAETKTAEPQKAEAPKAPAAKPPEVIPAAEIATQAMAVSNLLSAITAKFTSSPEIETINKSLPAISTNIDQQILRTLTILQQQPTAAMLQAQQQQWQQIQTQATDWLNLLTEQATRLQDELNRLAGLQKTWSSTRAAMQTSKQPGPILQQINATLSAIAAAQTPLQAQRTAVLALQGRVVHELERCVTALDSKGQGH